MYVSNISKSPGYTSWVAGSVSSPLDFQTEGPRFESHQCHMLFSYFFTPHSLRNARILMNVMFFVLINIENLTRGTFTSIAGELKHDGALSDQKLDGPSWRAEMKVQHHIYAVFKCIAFQFATF